MRILITGSRGFLGGSIGRFAAASGYEVLGLGRSPHPSPDWPGTYVQTDVSVANLAAIIRDFGPDTIWHAAGSASVSESFLAPLEDLRATVRPWANLLDGVRRSGLHPIVLFPSSAAVYGNPTALPVPEEAAIRPISPYGFHKATCELLAREYVECFGLDIVVCRFFSLFGATQRRLLIWEIFEQLAGPSSTVWLEGTGAEARDYLEIGDVWAVLHRLVHHQRVRGGDDRLLTVNIASGTETCVVELAKHVRDLVAPRKAIGCRGIERPGDPRRWRADISRVTSLVRGWEPQPLWSALPQCIAVWQHERARATTDAYQPS